MRVEPALYATDIGKALLIRRFNSTTTRDFIMKIWNKPQVREQAVGMEVTAYLPADIDLI